MTTKQVRSIFLSDIHLGTKACQADHLLEFLKEYSSEYVFLLGDIVDLWSMKRGGVYWSPAQNTFVQKMLRRSRHGEKVVFIPGNHDEAFRDYVGLHFGGVEIMPEAIHETADGRKLLIVHGDEFDGVVIYAKWLAFLGDHAYTMLLKFNRTVNAVRRWFKLPYWSLAAHLKKKVKNAVAFISSFEEAVARAAAERGADGVVCGHIHSAEIRQIGDVTYYNDGDWVESCTALVEHADWTMEILDWAAKVRDEKAAVRAAGRPVAAEVA